MMFDSFTISRYIFLGFIILISVYFIIENKSVKKIERFAEPEDKAAPKGSSEDTLKKESKTAADPKEPLPSAAPAFIGKDDASIRKAVEKAYSEMYQTSPEEEELSFYMEYAKSRNITYQQLKEVIETSAPTLQKTFYSKRNADTPDEVFGSENEIIEVYNELLMRNPDRRELYSFAKMMKDDPTFTMDKLRQVLIASEEFKRMERTQNNKVYVNLQSNITDRQLTMQVTKLHNDVTGKDYIDEDTLKFLKKKFVQFDLNEQVMIQFIQNYMSGKPFTGPAPSTQDKKAASDAQIAEIKKQIMADIEAAKQKEATAPAPSPSTPPVPATAPKQKEKFQDGTNVYNDANIYNFYGEGANEEVISSLLSKSTNKNGNIDTSSLIDNIKDGGSSCKFTKDAAEDEILARNKQELADYVNDRNMNHLKNVCTRNKKYINADDNMVLFPEYKWSVPERRPPVCSGRTETVSPLMDQTSLIGTLLPQAKDTKVGSILPVFPPV